MSALENIDSAYWNSEDCQINALHRHVPPTYNNYVLEEYYKHQGINSININNIRGLKRYIIENDGKPIAMTLQGAAYCGIDILTGRKVIIKSANKQLVRSHLCRNGTNVSEDIRKQAALMSYIVTANGHYSDSYISKFVDYFKTNDNYYLVVEHGGVELFDFIKENHPKDIKNNEKLIIEWKNNIRHYFRMLSRAIYYLHIHCNIVHLDISLENAVIDINTNVVRIIDFGLAKHFKSNKWKYGGVSGKVPYHTPEMRDIYNLIKKSKKRNIPIDAKTASLMGFDARSADVWALGTMLFIMLCKSQPWTVAEKKDMGFDYIINGRIEEVLDAWDCTKYVDDLALDLMKKIFKPEKERIDMTGVLNHPYVKYGSRKLYEINNLNKPKIELMNIDTTINENNKNENKDNLDIECIIPSLGIKQSVTCVTPMLSDDITPTPTTPQPNNPQQLSQQESQQSTKQGTKPRSPGTTGSRASVTLTLDQKRHSHLFRNLKSAGCIS